MAKKTGNHADGMNNGNIGTTANGVDAVARSNSNDGDSKSSEDTTNDK